MKPYEIILYGKTIMAIYAEFCQPVCQKHGINQTCLDILLFLANNPEYHSARDICEIRGIKSGIASVAVENLVKKGYLERGDSSKDRRIKLLLPTEAAAEIIRDGRMKQMEFFTEITAGIRPEEIEIHRSVTERFIKNVKRLEGKGKKNA